MIVEQAVWTPARGWTPAEDLGTGKSAGLAFLFGSTGALENTDLLRRTLAMCPDALFIGCSTSGEISGQRVHDDSLCLTAVSFAKTRLADAQVEVSSTSNSREVGQRLAGLLPHKDLVHVLVFSDGLQVNGTTLAAGLTEALPGHVTVTGGLAGDGSRFQKTLVVSRGQARSGIVAALGLYSDSLKVGYGSLGGWDSFGPERLITKAKGNVLFELDNKSALDLYKTYLGKHAKELPASGLLFPLSLRFPGQDRGEVVRTILSVDEKEQSLTFAGDVPEGAYARLMKANMDRLVDGSEGAARNSIANMPETGPGLALLISCVGRKLILKQRVEEEVEAAAEVFGSDTAITGFYSYGEISPLSVNGNCELHNQTMTITTLAEE